MTIAKGEIVMGLVDKSKIDAFLAIRGLFGSDAGKKGKAPPPVKEDFEDLSAFAPEIRRHLTERASRLNSLGDDQRGVWFALWRERLRGRGLTARLDPNVHAEQVAEVLRPEPLAVRSIIESHLPAEISSKVRIILQSSGLDANFEGSEHVNQVNRANPNLVRVVRERFLANFVAYEDLFEPNEIDGFTMRQLGNLIWKLGLCEIARVCRGIERIEGLAGFLQRFDEPTAQAIGGLINSMKGVDIERIRQAEQRVESVLKTEKVSGDQVRRIGMLIFAESLSGRTDEAIRFNLQKLPLEIEKELLEFVHAARRRKQSFSATINREISALIKKNSKGGD